TEEREAVRLYICTFVANLREERRIVRKHDQLLAAVAGPDNFMHRLAPTKGVLTSKWIIENDHAFGAIRVTLEMGDKYRKCEGTSVARARRVLKAGLIYRRFSVAEIYASVVDNKLVSRTRNSTTVRRFGLRDRKSRVKIVEQLVDSSFVWLHHLGGMLF